MKRLLTNKKFWTILIPIVTFITTCVAIYFLLKGISGNIDINISVGIK